MSEILAFISKHQERLKWVLVGALIALGLYISYEALVGVLALIFGPILVQDHKKVQKERREAIREFEKQSERVDQQAAELKELVKQTEATAGKKAAQEVDDFIDGEWK